MWQLGQEGSLGKSGHMYMYSWVPLLFTWNYHNIVNWLSPLLVTQSCLTLCNPMDCSSPGSSVHGILQARILEWFSIPFWRGLSQPRDLTQVPCIPSRFFTVWTKKEVPIQNKKNFFKVNPQAMHVFAVVTPVPGTLSNHFAERLGNDFSLYHIFISYDI